MSINIKLQKGSKKHKKVAFIVPAHNEEAVIAKTLKSILRVSNPKDIYVSNDGSTDRTGEIAKNFNVKLLNNYPNQGKASALNKAISKFRLSEKYEFIMFLDADTQISPHFLDFAVKCFTEDYKKKIICVVGKVMGSPNSWITTFRAWEYEVAQTIHKSAQNKEQAIAVCPGCATIYRAQIFRKLTIPAKTLTEDMDLTFTIHRKRLGRIVFEDKALVYTQDPQNLKDFLKQVDRWYTGFWQNVVKHNIPWKGQRLDFEAGMLAVDGLFSGLIAVMLILFIPLIYSRNITYLAYAYLIDLVIFVVPTLIFTAAKYSRYDILKYIFIFYPIRILSGLVFLKSFINIVLGIDLGMAWSKVTRYRVRREVS